ncbi:MAG: trypsin-like peptidase domain-containing protein [Nitrospirae bacterium]|nr:trypsin-like peptidase domain-containing protein [Nitrospirota bacterium]
MITLIAIITAVFVRDVFRDRKALEQARAGARQEPESVPVPPLGSIAGTMASPESVNGSEAVFRKASPSVVTVKIVSGDDQRMLVQGSGVVIGPGTVVTNRHVVESGSEIRVIDRGTVYPASVLYADREYDLCALWVTGLTAPPADMASSQTIRVGQRVYAIGSPRGLELSISDGLVSAIRSYGSFPVIQTNAPISKGSSGGGLFDADGRLVGVTTFTAIEGQNINFALVADLIPQLPARTADIRALKPIVPVQRPEEIGNKALLNGLQESRQAIAASEAELTAMGEEINRYAFTLNELKLSMDGFLSSRNTKAYNDMLPRYNDLAAARNGLADRYNRKRQAHEVLVEDHNRLAEQYRNQGRPR